MALNDPDLVAREYATETGLEGRRAAYRHATGPDAVEVALAAVLETRPASVLEVGCGTGVMAERIASAIAPEGILAAVDLSPRMVELTCARGVDAVVADVQNLPFVDASFDVAFAAWMLYHVPVAEKAIEELHRVLRPGGRLVAVTNASRHLAELRRLCGVEGGAAASFDEVSGERTLRDRFARVETRDAAGELRFPDRESVQAYAEATITLWPRGSGPLPPFEVPFVVTRAPVIFVATKAA